MARLSSGTCAGCVIVILSALLTDITKSENGFETIYSWKEVDFQFPPDTNRETLIAEKKFIKENNVVTGIKVFGDNIYLTVPRWRSGVPVTLATVPLKKKEDGPALKAFPGWEMNRLGNCSALQYVQSMEIDQFGRMWAVDVGRVNILEAEADNKCPPKLVLLDTGSKEVLLTYVFPPEVVSRNTSFLNDIAVGCVTEEDCWAFISDAGDAKIVFYNLEQKKSWFAKHSSMLVDPSAGNITIQGKAYAFKTAVNGIALSPRDSGFQRLYYSPLSSYNLYSVETSALRKLSELDGAGGDLQDSDVMQHGSKKSQTGGMIMDAEGRIYYGLLNDNSVYYWNSSERNLSESNQILVLKDDSLAQWPDTFAIGQDGNGYVTTNKLHQFTTNTYDFRGESNFRVLRFQVGVKSYMYSAPSMEDESDGSNEEVGRAGTTIESVTIQSFSDEVTERVGTESDVEEITTEVGKVGRCEECEEDRRVNNREGKKYPSTDGWPEKQKNKNTYAVHPHEHDHHDHVPEHYDHDHSQTGHDHSGHNHDHSSHNIVASQISALNTKKKVISSNEINSNEPSSGVSLTSHFLLAISSAIWLGFAEMIRY